MINCDLTSALEDGGIGAAIVAILVFLFRWWTNRDKQPATR